MADNCGYYRYLGDLDVPKAEGKIKPIDPDQLWPGVNPVDTEASESHSVPRVLTRLEKGQALTHLEMDFNLASFHHKLNTSSISSSFTPEESGEEEDVYFERHKPTRQEEMEGMFATFSYAPIVIGSESVIQNGFQTIKIQHTTDEIRYKLSNEQIPGTLDIAEDFHVTGSSYVAQDASVSGSVRVKQDISSDTLHVSRSATIGKDLRMAGTASIDGDVYIKGNLYVNGVMFGNLSRPEYNTPNYASPQPATISTGEGVKVKEFYTKAEVDQLLAALRSELLAEIHGQTQG